MEAAPLTSWPGIAIGMVTEKIDPTPTVLSTPTSPPSISASFLLNDRPSPVPRSFFWSGASTWTKSWKMAPRCSGAMPIPVSATEKVTNCGSVNVGRHTHFALEA